MKVAVLLLSLSFLLLTHTIHAQPNIQGRWVSVVPERTAGGNFGIREFWFDKNNWEVQYTLYTDSSLSQPIFTFRAVGDYQMDGPSPVVANTAHAIFRFSKKYITLKTRDTLLANKTGLKSCKLLVNEERDISKTGCGYFASNAGCAQEYDLVRVQDQQLFLGARPASGGMCEPGKRPRALAAPLKKYEHAAIRATTSGLPFKNIVDLTHTLNDKFPFIPTSVTYGFELKPIATLEGFGVAANEWRIHEHLGTQFDAPNHFIKNGMSAEKIPVELLLVPVVVMDISEKAAKNRDAELTIADITSWENQHGKIPDNAAVCMYSGWETKIHQPDFLGLDSAHVKHFPGISKEAATFLMNERNVAGVGVDVISIDPGYDGTYQTHRAILGKGKWALECLANLSSIPAKGAFVFVGAPKVEGATGGLARVVAVW